MENTILTTISTVINGEEFRSDNLPVPGMFKSYEEFERKAKDVLERWFLEVKHFGFNEDFPVEYEGVYVDDDEDDDFEI